MSPSSSELARLVEESEGTQALITSTIEVHRLRQARLLLALFCRMRLQMEATPVPPDSGGTESRTRSSHGPLCQVGKLERVGFPIAGAEEAENNNFAMIVRLLKNNGG